MKTIFQLLLKMQNYFGCLLPIHVDTTKRIELKLCVDVGLDKE